MNPRKDLETWQIWTAKSDRDALTRRQLSHFCTDSGYSRCKRKPTSRRTQWHQRDF